MKEVCSCTASITLPDAKPAYRDQWDPSMKALQDWRENHRHEMPPPESEIAESPYVHESGSSHERAPQYISTENDIPFGFTRNA